MKKVKQILSLMLVIALALGMMSFAAAAPASKNVDDYKDFEDIKNREAVDVLTAIGILEGDTAGAFNPKSTITREEAAKIVTYVYAGSAAKNLPKRTSVFTDVENDRWSNPFIMYCQEYGIINGFGDGTFRPTEPVTASQMAKMLLMAIGYGKKEEFIGAKWEGNAIVTAQEVGVLPKSITANYTQDATREDVAQYAFFALVQPTAVFNSFYNEYFTTAGYSGVVTGTGTTLNPSLAAKMFDLHAQPVPDDFGYNLAYWYQGVQTNRLTGLYMRDIVLGEFTIKPTTSKGEMFNNYAWDINGIELYVNGTKYDRDSSGAAVEAGTASSTNWLVSDFSSKGSFAMPGPSVVMPGVYVTLVDSTGPNGMKDNVVDKVIVTYEYLAKVEAVNTMFGTINVTYYNLWGEHPENGILAEDFSVGDYVNIIWKSDPDDPANKINPTVPISIEKATSESATFKAYTELASYMGALAGRPDTITLGDKVYTLSATALAVNGSNVSPLAKNLTNTIFSTEITVWFDSHDNIIGYDAVNLAAGSLNYLYVTGKDVVNSAPDAFSRYPARVAAVMTNGEHKIFELVKVPASAATIKFNGTDYDTTQDASNGYTALATAITEGWYAYTLNSSGQVHLFKTGATAAAGSGLLDNEAVVRTETDIQIIKGVATISSSGTTAYAGSNTLLSVVTGGTAKTYTGYANFPTLLLDGTDDYYVLFIYARTGPASVSSSVLTHIYVVEKSLATQFAEYGVVMNVAKYELDSTLFNVLVKDGSTKTVSVPNVEASAFSSLPVIAAINEDGSMEVASTSDITGIDEIDAGGGNAYFIEGSDIYHYSADTIFYDNTTVPASSGNAVKPKTGDDVTIICDPVVGVSNSYTVHAVIVTSRA